MKMVKIVAAVLVVILVLGFVWVSLSDVKSIQENTSVNIPADEAIR